MIDKDSKGYLNKSDIGCVFDLIGVDMRKVPSSLNLSKMEIENFANIFRTDIRQTFTHTMRLNLLAFDFFSGKDKNKGCIKRTTLLNVLKCYGNEKWEECKAIRTLLSLRGVGFDERNVNYSSVVETILNMNKRNFCG